MSPWLVILMMVAGGAIMSFQAPINAAHRPAPVGRRPLDGRLDGADQLEPGPVGLGRAPAMKPAVLVVLTLLSCGAGPSPSSDGRTRSGRLKRIDRDD